MEACGLKYSQSEPICKPGLVTPYGGVWIEITAVSSSSSEKPCHALWRRVD